MKKIEDYEPRYTCRFHPTDWFHEIGCSHQSWSAEELQRALDSAKQSIEYLSYKAFGKMKVLASEKGTK